MAFNGNISAYFSLRVFITGMVIQLISIFNIFTKDQEPYSLYKTFFLFSLFFFGIAPLLQSYNNTMIWYTRPLNETEYFYTNILIILILLFYQITYITFRKLKINNTEQRIIDKLIISNLSITKKKKSLLLIVSFFSFFVIFKHYHYLIIPMLVRGGEVVSSLTNNFDGEGMSSTSWLIVSNFIRPLAMMCLYYYFMYTNTSKEWTVLFLSLAVITNFPTGLSRYAAAAMYIPLLLLKAPIMRKKNVFSLTLISGLLLVFPFLSKFRTLSENSQLQLKFDLNMFTSGDFDSYQNFAIVISNNIITYGNQLLGVLFFWIPRSVWPSKPIGSGAFLAEKSNFFFSNVSANYFAEGYINFGFFGIFIFTILLAYITSKMDKIYWEHVLESKQKSFFSIFYLISIGMLFFILRGDLLSSFAYTIGFMCSAVFIFLIINNKKRNERT